MGRNTTDDVHSNRNIIVNTKHTILYKITIEINAHVPQLKAKRRVGLCRRNPCHTKPFSQKRYDDIDGVQGGNVEYKKMHNINKNQIKTTTVTSTTATTLINTL